MNYDFTAIEKKWQKKWLENKTYAAVTGDPRPKFYGLVEFPYPSGQGLHVGHPRPYTAMDIVCRKKRMQGYNVLFPIGFDAFGLPTENYAIKNHIHPSIVTEQNIKHFTEQLQMLGFSFDWDRVVDTTDPKYYKWTQWIFLQLYKKGLAYKATMPVNWCTSCKCVLANEEVVEGVCERCGAPVVRKEKSQWMLKITEYAQRLIDDLDDLDYIERVKTQQKNWIGRSTGAQLRFKSSAGDDIEVFTTRPDTLFGCTYMVLSPEHAFVKKWQPLIKNYDEVQAYVDAAARKSDFERTELAANKEKTGVRLDGVVAINPANGEEVPIFISDYVLATYGTGAVMGVPGHDQRDWDFATKFGLPIIEVVKGGDVTKEAFILKDDTGIMVNSGFMNGMTVKQAIPAMIDWVEEQNIGVKTVNYKLRDWVFSRQRYWGEPIPMVNCPKCGWVPLPEDQLPLLLPDVENYEPTDNGESPLAKMTDWVNTTCPHCGGKAQRETDTMPQWAGSSWYFLRYMDPHNDKAMVGKEAMDYWHQVDWYNGGMEHTTLHLLYSRFWHKVLFDCGVVPTAEPYQKRTSHGMILGLNPHSFDYLPEEEKAELMAQYGDEAAVRAHLREKYGEMADHPIVKMSKSLGNVVNPDDVVQEFGADTLRVYIMFLGDFEKAAPWQTSAVKGCKRFLDRVWNLAERCGDSLEHTPANEMSIHKTIKKVTDDIDAMKFNTAIAAMMSLVNDYYSNGCTKGDVKTLLLLLSPFAPHMVEEMWENMGFAAAEGKMACETAWPAFDESKTVEHEKEIAVQVNGKLRSTVKVPADCDDETVIAAACADEKIQKQLQGMKIVKSIVVKNKLVNLILKPE
ncbi:MAG: leucine--tRNA ligase [Oscillospiraceae bacterium]|jgi:leucyl-tRNA synthetase|nr:leucine--tRNA ligase [Oscillospiraceae bacterium]